ncbi:MAG: cation diffusion facilitator family transporter [Anaerolineae bacterium]|jgi:cation diffusion facilitator family transporter
MKATQESGELRTLKLAVGLYVFTFALKLAIYFVTDVMAMLAQAMHALSDIIVSGFLLVATIWSRKEADEVHMFGYGRAQSVAALVAATLFLSFTSFELYKESIPRLFRPEEATYQNLPLALGVLVFSMLISAAPLVSLIRQKKRGATAKAQLLELLNDELGMAAALIGTLFIMWGRPLADPIATVIIATIIAYNAVGLFRENLCFLMGRSPGPEFLARVESVAHSVEGMLGVHGLRAEYVGPDSVHTGMHIEVQRGTAIEEADRIAEEVRERIHQETGCLYCVIHMDAADSGRSSTDGA